VSALGHALTRTKAEGNGRPLGTGEHGSEYAREELRAPSRPAPRPRPSIATFAADRGPGAMARRGTRTSPRTAPVTHSRKPEGPCLAAPLATLAGRRLRVVLRGRSFPWGAAFPSSATGPYRSFKRTITSAGVDDRVDTDAIRRISLANQRLEYITRVVF
jgi:hypothetical protein